MAFKNKVVVHWLDGRIAKGFTLDFVPGKDGFHLADAEDERKVVEVRAMDLKAVFFVRSFEGNKDRNASVPDPWDRAGGQRLKVTFLDGEVVHGTTTAYTPGRKGFFIVPADQGDNNERAYVFTDATRKVEIIPASVGAQPAGASGTR